MGGRAARFPAGRSTSSPRRRPPPWGTARRGGHRTVCRGPPTGRVAARGRGQQAAPGSWRATSPRKRADRHARTPAPEGFLFGPAGRRLGGPLLGGPKKKRHFAQKMEEDSISGGVLTQPDPHPPGGGGDLTPRSPNMNKMCRIKLADTHTHVCIFGESQ